MDGHEVDIRDLPELTKGDLLNMVAAQAARIASLKAQLRAQGRGDLDWEQVRAEQDAALMREGVL